MFRYIGGFLVILLSVVIFSCENNIEVVNAITNTNQLPEVAGEEVEILYYDSARLKVRIVTKKLNRFRKDKFKPYIEFPEGIHVYFYDELKNINGEVSARYAIYKESEKLWEAQRDVVVINVAGDRLNTEQLFWDENREEIWTEKYAKVTKVNGEISIGEKGLRAKQDFSWWRLFGTSGKMKFREDEP